MNSQPNKQTDYVQTHFPAYTDEGVCGICLHARLNEKKEPIHNIHKAQEDPKIGTEQGGDAVTIEHETDLPLAAERDATHGDWRENLQTIADMWTAWLGFKVTDYDVAIMMVMLKQGRMNGGKVYCQDHYDDAGVYLKFAELLDPRRAK